MYVAFESDYLSQAPVVSTGQPGRGDTTREARARLRPGQYLFHQGDEAQTIYRVASGVVRLSRVTEKGKGQVVAFGYPGDIIGLPMRGLRTTDCEALTPVTLTVVPARLPTEGAGSMAEAAFLAAAALCEIAAMQEHLMTLGRTSARERIASFLLVLMRRAGTHDESGIHLDLPMSRSDIADFLGLRTETVSRAFTDLRQAGVIALPSAQNVSILDPGALADIAEGD